jgi:hypothetical protein
MFLNNHQKKSPEPKSRRMGNARIQQLHLYCLESFGLLLDAHFRREPFNAGRTKETFHIFCVGHDVLRV